MQSHYQHQPKGGRHHYNQNHNHGNKRPWSTVASQSSHYGPTAASDSNQSLPTQFGSTQRGFQSRSQNYEQRYHGRGQGGSGRGRGYGRQSSSGRVDHSRSYFKPSMLLDPWAKLSAQMIREGRLDPSEAHVSFAPYRQENLNFNHRDAVTVEDTSFLEIAFKPPLPPGPPPVQPLLDDGNQIDIDDFEEAQEADSLLGEEAVANEESIEKCPMPRDKLIQNLETSLGDSHGISDSSAHSTARSIDIPESRRAALVLPAPKSA